MPQSTIEKSLESTIHKSFTVKADDLYGAGYMSREERIALSSAIGDMLDDWRKKAAAKLQKAGVQNPDETLQRTIEAQLKEFFFDIPYGQDGTRDGMTTRHDQADQEYPYDEETDQRMSFSDDGATMKGFPDSNKTKGDDDDRKVWRAREESVDLAGAGGQALNFEFMASKDRKERQRDWSHGQKFYDDDDGDFNNNQNEEEKDHNYKKESARMDKKKLIREIFLRESVKKIVEDVKVHLLEKTPPGKYKTGTPYEKIVKGVKRSGSDVNPWAVAWNLKNKGKKECKDINEMKEFVDNYMKEMGFHQSKTREGCDIWKRKKAK